MAFDKTLVLERILQEAPVLSNRRGEIKVDGQVKKGNEWVKRKVKVPIYAYYFNMGVKDPDLKYDRIGFPIKTSHDSTLAEVYSFWEGNPNIQELVKKLEERGEIKKGEVIYQGPGIKGVSFKEVKERTRRQDCVFSFNDSASTFEWHFNKITEELGYDVRLISLSQENYGFFDCGAYALQSPRQVSFSMNREVRKGLIDIRVPIGLNLNRIDPTLNQMLGLIERAYKKIQKADFSGAKLYLE